MLKHLTIKNYALIRHLEMEPSGSLNVITGETGAGKSIMLGALGLLMGNRADTKVLWDEEDKCIIEGVFNIRDYKLKSMFRAEDLDYDDQTVIRREISPGGKSRAFINDTPVTLEVMRKIGSVLMDIHSQHETLHLGNQFFQLQLIDTYAENNTLRDQYQEAWQSFLKAKKAFETLSDQAESLRQEADYTKFQLDELLSAALEENEQEKLEDELKIMEHAEEIKTKFTAVLDLLNNSEFSTRNSLGEIRAQLQGISGYSASYQSLFERLESVRIELDDIAAEIEKEEGQIEFDPARSEWIKERLSTLYRLLKKHKAAGTRELMVLQENLRQKANLTSNLDQELDKAKETYTTAEKKVRSLAALLTETRKKAFDPLKKQLTKLLKELGIPDAVLAVENQITEPTPSGVDKIEIMFSANKGIPPRPLAQVASGGEFSRLMFCVKYVMAEKSAMPTLVLDEIDNGVSGEIAIKLGNMMQAMSKTHQLMAISHLPQIAAKGEAHYFVFKDSSAKKTVSNIKLLTASERVEEIAKMIGGAKPSKVALENAQELLAR
jgi:DNA repair protein RecN (Recombination protein N)